MGTGANDDGAIASCAVRKDLSKAAVSAAIRQVALTPRLIRQHGPVDPVQNVVIRQKRDRAAPWL